VLVRALQRDPAARYESAEAFGRALSALLPDPITARDAVTRFYQQIEALDRGTRAASGTPRSASPSQPSMSPSRAHDSPPFSVGGIATVVAGAMISLTLLGAIGVVGLLALSNAAIQPRDPVGGPPVAAGTPGLPEVEPTALVVPSDEPAGPAGEGAPGERRPPPTSRRPPVGSVTPPSAPDPVPVVIVTPVPVPSPAPSAPVPPVVASGEAGSLFVDSKQPAEVYVAGQYVSAAPARKDLPPGRYAVSIVAADGRRRSFEVEIEAGGKVKKVWDFDRMEWR
jgi:hypothetical protein